MHHSDRGSPVRQPCIPGQVEGVRHGLFDAVFYNRKRLHSMLGDVAPQAFLQTGSALNTGANSRHNAEALEDEKQREPHCLGSINEPPVSE
jgi:hypothetical protein